LTGDGSAKIDPMALNLLPLLGTSREVRDYFFKPLTQVLTSGLSFRQCPRVSDPEWIYAGVERVVASVRSGREFLQNFFKWLPGGIALSPYFKALHSPRRLEKVAEVDALVRAVADQTLPNALPQFPELDGFAVYAGDGHYVEHATHDPKTGETFWPTGYFFAMDIKTQTLRLLGLADAKSRKKEHDMRALKRFDREELRQGAPVGDRVMWVWDKAAIDLPFWQKAKQCGVYFLCLKKENQCLERVREREIDFAQKINEGVQWDHVVMDRQGIQVREIGFYNPQDGLHYIYLTSEMTLEPGLLVLLYTCRWGIEKIFDETKNKFNQKKSWATSEAAKKTQAHFMCLAHNLTLLLEHRLELDHGIRQEAELRRKQKRQEVLVQSSQEWGQPRPWLYSLLRRFSQASFKLVRWLWCHWKINTSLPTALAQLRLLYAKL
jgi:Transposase DDE domain